MHLLFLCSPSLRTGNWAAIEITGMRVQGYPSLDWFVRQSVSDRCAAAEEGLGPDPEVQTSEQLSDEFLVSMHNIDYWIKPSKNL